MTIYLSCKYIRQSGGAQDNQIGDLRETIRLFVKFLEHNKTKRLACCLDGSYGRENISLLRETIPEEYSFYIFVGTSLEFIKKTW